MNYDRQICTIGGGSGMPIVNRSLLKAGFGNIASVVTTFDSGGDSGRMRTDERGRILAFSDYWRSLMSLWIDGQQKKVWDEMLKYRDGRGRNFGNTFFQFMEEKTGDLGRVQELFSQLTGARICGKVIPVSMTPSNIVFRTKSQRLYVGEHRLDEMRMSRDRVEEIWLQPKARAGREAKAALEKAEVIIICPGSMYGSALINLLPVGMKEAFNRSKAKKILFTNIMTMSVENDGFDQNDYVRLFGKYLDNSKPFDMVIMPDLEKLKSEDLEKVLKYYACENSYPVKYNSRAYCFTRKEDIALIETEHQRLRHSERKMAKLMINLLV